MGRQNAFIVQPELKQPLAKISARTPQTKLKEASGLAEAIQLEVIHQEIIYWLKTFLEDVNYVMTYKMFLQSSISMKL